MVELQDTWSWLPAIYLFLGGLSAGAFLTSAGIKLVRPGKFQKTVMGGMWITVAALAIGLFSLISEVEKPLQAMWIPGSFINPTSWMTVGAWLLLVSFLVFALNALLSTPKIVEWIATTWKTLPDIRLKLEKVLAIIGIPCAICVAVYTGILLGAAPAIPLWNTWLLPVLFTVSAFDTGLAAVLILASFIERDEAFDPIRTLLEKMVVGLVLLEGVVLIGFVVTMQSAGSNEAASVGILTSGDLSGQFWGLVVVVGLFVPFGFALSQILFEKGLKKDKQISTALPVVGGTCALIGGFTLRFVILAAGIHAALVSPALLQAVEGVSMFIS